MCISVAENLAMKKPAFQSSNNNYRANYAYHAVDGSYANYLSRTKVQNNAWWAVDLQVEAVVHAVKIPYAGKI